MAAVLTLTMNPALDLSSETGHIEPGRKTRCSGPRQTPGGGGINVARGIRTLGGEVLAVYPCGGPAGERLDALLAEAGVPTRTVSIAASWASTYAGKRRAALLAQRCPSSKRPHFCSAHAYFVIVMPLPASKVAAIDAW